MGHDVNDYDREVQAQRWRAQQILERHAQVYGPKSIDDRGLEGIAHGLQTIRNSCASQHVDQWADAAWALALELFGAR